MLVLSRGKNESIIIADKIRIKVVDVRSDGTVKLGIEAPLDIEIFREEVYVAIQEENKLAAQTLGDLEILGDLFKKGK